MSAVTEDGHRLGRHDLVHEDPNHVPIAVGRVLVLPVDVVRTEDRVLKSEVLARRLQVQLDCHLGDAVGVYGAHRVALPHRELPMPVHRDRTRENKMLDAVAQREADESSARHNVVLVVEAADVVRKALGGIGTEMEHVPKSFLLEEVRHQPKVDHGALDEGGALGHVLDEPSAQVIHHDDAVALLKKFPGHVRAEESSPTSNETIRHAYPDRSAAVVQRLESRQAITKMTNSAMSVVNR